MKELQEIINVKVKQMIDNGSIKTAIEDGISNAIETAISNQFKPYGNITKQIEEMCKNGLKINTEDLPFESYSAQMLSAIKVKLGNMIKGNAAEKFFKEIDKVLDPAPDKISLNKFVENIIEMWKDCYADDLDDYATVELNESEHITNGFDLKMWKRKSGISSSNCDLNIFISNNKIRILHNHYFNPTCFDDAEGYVFKLYAAGTEITDIDKFDPYCCDLSLKDF